MAEWYYARNNQRLGPVTMEQLKQLGTSGQLSPGDLVWKDGMANWAPASSIPGLFAAPAPAPVQKAPAPAAVASLAPPPGGVVEEVLPLTMGPAGPSIVDTAMLIATRAVSPDLETMKVSEAEQGELAKAGVTGETAQRYLVWRRSLLWVAAVPLVFTGLSLVIDSAIYSFDSLNGFGILLEVVRILTLLALPAAAILAALTWSKPKTSQMITTLGFLVCYGVPLLVLLMPTAWYAKGPAGGTVMYVALLMTLVSIPPAMIRGCLRLRTLLPESVVIGLLLVGLSVMSALFFFGVVFGSLVPFIRLNSSFLGMLFGLLITLAPISYVVGRGTFLRPIATAGDRSAVALWQWIYYGVCGGAALVFILYLLTGEGSLGAYGVWVGLLLYLDFLGRSLFASVVAAHFILSLSRSVIITQSQLTKTDQGTALDRRFSELDPVVGKM